MFDPYNKRLVYTIYNTEASTPELEPGTGPIIKLYFTVPADAEPEQFATLTLDGFLSYYPLFSGSIINYNPTPVSGSVSLPFMCGDVNDDEIVNLFDITYLIAFLYQSGPPPEVMAGADVNGDTLVNIFDVTFLIAYLYQSGPPLDCPN